MWNFPLFPPQATGYAAKVDTLYIALLLLALAFTLGIAFSILYFVVRYRKGAKADRGAPPNSHIRMELAWIFIPFGLGLLIYAWAGFLYLQQQSIPKNALTIYVMGQQWMWKFQHPAGKREIDELHIPIGRPVRLVMTSQDVIHSLFVPAFRVKQDVLPGRYTQLWFQATKLGKFHLFCAEYCGTQHSGMTGWVTVMEPAAYEQWLSQVTTATSAATGTPPAARGPSMASQGEQLFRQFGCSGCHQPGGKGPCPDLTGKFGKPVALTTGKTVPFDEQYVQESVLEPNAKIAAGYAPMMPSFKGQIGQEQIMQIIAYLQSLGKAAKNGP